MRSARMPMRLARFVQAVLFAAAAAAPAAGGVSMAQRPVPIAPHRDGNVAVAEELDAARRAGTLAAYDLFLARHPTHKLAQIARRERAIIASGRPR